MRRAYAAPGPVRACRKTDIPTQAEREASNAALFATTPKPASGTTTPAPLPGPTTSTTGHRSPANRHQRLTTPLGPIRSDRAWVGEVRSPSPVPKPLLGADLTRWPADYGRGWSGPARPRLREATRLNEMSVLVHEINEATLDGPRDLRLAVGEEDRLGGGSFDVQPAYSTRRLAWRRSGMDARPRTPEPPVIRIRISTSGQVGDLGGAQRRIVLLDTHPGRFGTTSR
jgi:hypothetical protein